MIERETDITKFILIPSLFELRAGGLYQVSLATGIRFAGGFRLETESGSELQPRDNEFVMCVSTPEKLTYGNFSLGLIQYWSVKFLYDEKVGFWVVIRSPLDLREFEYEANLRLIQIQ